MVFKIVSMLTYYYMLNEISIKVCTYLNSRYTLTGKWMSHLANEKRTMLWRLMCMTVSEVVFGMSVTIQ